MLVFLTQILLNLSHQCFRLKEIRDHLFNSLVFKPASTLPRVVSDQPGDNILDGKT